MKWKDKIRRMNDDELAELLSDSSSAEGFMGVACSRCPHLKNEWECAVEGRDCKAAVKKLLESEVDDEEK